MNINLKFLWNTVIMRRITYDCYGLPMDCKGLRYRGGLPLKVGTEYYLTTEYRRFGYLGHGIYTTAKGITADTKNPYFAGRLRKEAYRFKGG